MNCILSRNDSQLEYIALQHNHHMAQILLMQ